MYQYKKGCIHFPRDVPCEFVKGEKHNDIIITFDIEVSSGWLDDNGQVVPWDKNKNDEWFKDHTPVALPYIWQASVGSIVWFGRELKTALDFFTEIDKKLDGVKYVYIHNLSYEFQFLCNIFKWDDVFARKSHKVMKCKPQGLNIEFRCSYFLTRLSLEAWGKQTGVNKKVGQLDYNILRTPLTELTEKELEYCEYDCIVMYQGLKKYLEKYGHLRKIPLTQTGEVRAVVKDLFKKDMNHLLKMTDLIPNNFSDFMEQNDRFRGGDTHANWLYAGETQKNVKSKDECSAYPSVMVCEEYPVGRWTSGCYDFSNKSYAYMLEVEFFEIESTTFCNYISVSKCENCVGATNDNGKVMCADYIRIKLIDVDFWIIEKSYKWKRLNVISCFKSRKAYLPKKYVEYTLNLYSDKTTLKGLEDMSDLYLQKKQYVNSLYGMMVTNPINDTFIWTGTEWDCEEMTEKDFNNALAELKKKFYKNFTAYQFGLWVTGWARLNLWLGILELDKEVVYYDTDSIKYLDIADDSFFERYNKNHIEKMKNVCDKRGLDFNLTQPKDIHGVVHPLGVWEDDGLYSEFKTWGAKRYAYRDVDDNSLHITVSGVNKKLGVRQLKNDIENFTENIVFEPENCGKLLMTYLNDMPKTVWDDGYVCDLRFGINARPIGYSMSLTDDYLTLTSNKEYNCELLKKGWW